MQVPIARHLRRNRPYLLRFHIQRLRRIALHPDRKQLLDDVLRNVGLFRAQRVEPLGKILRPQVDQFFDLLEQWLFEQFLVRLVQLRLPLDSLFARFPQEALHPVDLLELQLAGLCLRVDPHLKLGQPILAVTVLVLVPVTRFRTQTVRVLVLEVVTAECLLHAAANDLLKLPVIVRLQRDNLARPAVQLAWHYVGQVDVDRGVLQLLDGSQVKIICKL